MDDSQTPLNLLMITGFDVRSATTNYFYHQFICIGSNLRFEIIKPLPIWKA